VPAPEAGTVAAAACLGLVVRDLGFGYAADRPRALDGVSFDVPAGGRLGITGPTGAGKSTIVSLLLRFWEYEEGSIALTDAEGHEYDLRSLTGDEARRLFAVVPQSPHLFHATLRENLELAAADRALPLEPAELTAALAASGLEDLVSRLPDGLNTVVGEAGRKLSAGEVKRVAIARALLKPAPILVLDEPTEGLDDRTAEPVLAALDRIARGRTLIVLSHRAQDLALAPRVVELWKGGVP
jgi:ABC-type multidrug transport system fused ATPase/permease subunit